MTTKEPQIVHYCNQIRAAMLDCPFCGALMWNEYAQLVIERILRDGYEDCQDDQDAWAYYVRCCCCGAEGGWAKCELGSIEKWNMRKDNGPNKH